jgi:hypothetical protein
VLRATETVSRGFEARREAERVGTSRENFEAFCLHYAGRVDECEDREYDLLRERRPGAANTIETRVN